MTAPRELNVPTAAELNGRRYEPTIAEAPEEYQHVVRAALAAMADVDADPLVAPLALLTASAIVAARWTATDPAYAEEYAEALRNVATGVCRQPRSRFWRGWWAEVIEDARQPVVDP